MEKSTTTQKILFAILEILVFSLVMVIIYVPGRLWHRSNFAEPAIGYEILSPLVAGVIGGVIQVILKEFWLNLQIYLYRGTGRPDQ